MPFRLQHRLCKAGRHGHPIIMKHARGSVCSFCVFFTRKLLLAGSPIGHPRTCMAFRGYTDLFSMLVPHRGTPTRQLLAVLSMSASWMTETFTLSQG